MQRQVERWAVVSISGGFDYLYGHRKRAFRQTYETEPNLETESERVGTEAHATFPISLSPPNVFSPSWTFLMMQGCSTLMIEVCGTRYHGAEPVDIALCILTSRGVIVGLMAG
jgi:hypothetical protein